MTEQEWLFCKEPGRMLKGLRVAISGRKLRLFAVACCRRVWPLLQDERSRRAVEVAERHADGLANDQELEAAAAGARAAMEAWRERARQSRADAGTLRAHQAAWAAVARLPVAPPWAAQAMALSVAAVVRQQLRERRSRDQQQRGETRKKTLLRQRSGAQRLA